MMPSRFRLPRPLLLPALAIVLGVLLAGLGLFRPVVKPQTVVPPGYAALVNQKGILLNDFRAQVELELSKRFTDATPAERAHVLREMVNEELLVQRAVLLDLPETANEVRSSMAVGVEAQVAAPVLAYQPTDAELRQFYENSKANYTNPGSMTVHDLVLHVGGYANANQSVTQAQADALEAVYQLRSGAGRDYVMAHFGFVPSGRVAAGEELDFAAKLHLGDKLYAVAAALRDGEVSEPIVDWDGVHVLVMERHQFPQVADFNTVRDRVYLAYRSAASNRATSENLRQLRSQASILIAPGFSE